ncbi:unnamed protein product [Thelazia callipaeda]|uniref:Secreted protein n=1 Tax=Thelazia callipaeda TaxID=103827 RepID=A0A0N5D503_THECL|nr:unnamed protein product [Thelazia callipaeda]
MELDKLFVVIQLLTLQTVSHAIKCFTCASADYKVLFERFSNIRHSLHIPRFGELCDNFERLHAFAPALNCESTCISILEPQYFGGVQSTNRPYSYIRGCAGKIFSSVQNRSPEVDFLHTEAICLELPLSLIWPSIETDEHVQASLKHCS